MPELTRLARPVPSPPARSAAVDLRPPGHHEEREAEARADRVLRDTQSGRSAHDAPEAVSTTGSNGRPLDVSTRTFFEDRFGADLSGVRVHTEGGAARAAERLGAEAFTVGRDIAFGPGEYRPASHEGRRLLAHELAHTLQPNAASRPMVRPKLRVNPRVSLDLHGFSARRSGDVYTGAAIARNSLSNEVFSSLLTSPREFEVAGTTSPEAEASLQRHMAARFGVVDFASKKRYSFGAGAGNFHMNPAFWDVGSTSYKEKAGVSRQKAIEDLNVHPELYAIACQAATNLTLEGGGKSPPVTDHGVAEDDWVPGDAGYVENTSFKKGADKVGLEGENIIYTGKGKYWGHLGSGVDYRTLPEWVDQVKVWGAPKIAGYRDRPTSGIF